MKLVPVFVAACVLSAGLVTAAQSVVLMTQPPASDKKQIRTPILQTGPTSGPIVRFSFAGKNPKELPSGLQLNANPAESLLAPGIYKTMPYTCIVVAPGPHADDRAIVKPGVPEPRILKKTPDLQFIPRSSKQPPAPKRP